MKNQQSYNNHIRWYVPHHFIFYPVMLALIVFTAYRSSQAEGEMALLWAIGCIGFACLTWLSFMLRQHYALTLQNRLVLLELRYRYFAITGKRLEPLEKKLSEGQLFALRFAPDNELPMLLDKAIADNLSGDAIKKSIKNWQADHRRV